LVGNFVGLSLVVGCPGGKQRVYIIGSEGNSKDANLVRNFCSGHISLGMVAFLWILSRCAEYRSLIGVWLGWS
jgi:hypothetical protein